LSGNNMDRREFIAGSITATTIGTVSGAQRSFAGRTRKPNILIFVADDASARHFGAFGNEVIQTPNIDELARNGVAFDKAMLTTAQCSPSRISILSGLYPHGTGAEDLHMPLPSGIRILPSYLQDAGYFTGHMQKKHEGPEGDLQFQWYDEGLEKFDGFVEAAGERPFFLWVAFDDPHRPYEVRPIIDDPHDPAGIDVPPYMADTPETRADIAKYYDEISRLDSVVGRFMQTLRTQDLIEHTLLSDNGAPLPREKGTVYDSGVRTPLILHWPSVVPQGDRHAGLASVIDLAPTLLALAGLEIPPAMQGSNQLEGLRNPEVWTRHAAFSERNWHDIDEHIRSIRTQDYRLIYNSYIWEPFGTPADVSHSPSWRSLRALQRQGRLTSEQADLFRVPRPQIEFYKTTEDPLELNNLAGAPEYEEAIFTHFGWLKEWMQMTGDFPPHQRQRAAYADRITGVLYSLDVPPMYSD